MIWLLKQTCLFAAWVAVLVGLVWCAGVLVPTGGISVGFAVATGPGEVLHGQIVIQKDIILPKTGVQLPELEDG